MKRQLRDILHKYETVLQANNGYTLDCIPHVSYESLIEDLEKFIEENKE